MRTRSWLTPLTLAVIVVVMVVTSSLWMARMTWFSDDWSFLDQSRSITGHGASAVLSSYNQHWSSVPILVYRATLGGFGMNSYYPFMVPLILAHTANVLLTRTLLLRTGIAPGLATLLPLTMIFLASAYTDLLWGFPVNLVGAVTLGLVAAYLVTGADVRRGQIAAAAVVLLLASATSNVGVAMTVAVALQVLLTRGWRPAFVVAAVPAAGYLAWYATWGRREGSACEAGLDLGAVPLFMVKALEKGLSGLTAVTGGSLLVAALIVIGLWHIVRRRQFTAYAWALSSGVGCLALYLLSALGRSGCVDDASRAPRYAYFAVLALPLVAVALDRFWRRSTVRAGIVAAIVLVTVVVNYVHLDRLADCRSARVQTGYAQLSFIPERPSALNPQATPALLEELTRDDGLRLAPRAAVYPDDVGGC